MRLDAGRDLVLRDVRESDAADLLPVTQELGPAQDEKPAECLLQRVGLARTGAGLETERSEEHTSELQSLMRISYAVFCLKKKNRTTLSSTSRHTAEEHN